MTRPEITLVLARADNGVIGLDNAMPWRIPADLRHFRAKTMGTPMLMGRKTFESLPGLLAGRRHIVLTRDTGWSAPGAETVHTIDQALAAVEGPLSVVGGAEIYALLEPRADRIELTEVHLAPDGDTRVPPFDPAIWREVARDDVAADGAVPAYSWVTLLRREPRA